MSKLDEIQERIDTVQRECLCSPESEAFIGILTDLVSELKRIDAEQAQIKAILPPSWNKGPLGPVFTREELDRG